MLYDPYGRVITSQLTSDLAQSLADQGSLEDPTTGLIHLGGGRFYDPSLGRPLQPNPIGGPPTVPQALNRYAATSVGQPGVGAAASKNWLADVYGLFSIAKGTAIDLAGLYPMVTGYKYVGQVSIAVESSRNAFNRRLPQSLKGAFGELRATGKVSIYRKTGSLLVGGSTKQELKIAAQQIEDALIDALPKQGMWKAEVSVLGIAVRDRLPQHLKLGKFSGFKAFKYGLGPALDVGVGGYLQYLEDGDNPYLTPGQKVGRAIMSGGGSAGTAFATLKILAILGCTGSLYCGITAAVIGTAIWQIGQPLLFQWIPGLKPADRDLQPLNSL